jgi:outer membrane protein assembly factor BamB
VRLAWSTRIALSTSPDNGGIFQSPSYKDGLLYVAGGVPTDRSCAGAIWALYGDTGAVAWKSCTKIIVFSPGAITGDVMFVADYNGSLSAYDLKTGSILWHSTLAGQVWGGTAIAHGKVVIATLKGKLYCFSLDGSG